MTDIKAQHAYYKAVHDYWGLIQKNERSLDVVRATFARVREAELAIGGVEVARPLLLRWADRYAREHGVDPWYPPEWDGVAGSHIAPEPGGTGDDQ